MSRTTQKTRRDKGTREVALKSNVHMSTEIVVDEIVVVLPATPGSGSTHDPSLAPVKWVRDRTTLVLPAPMSPNITPSTRLASAVPPLRSTS